MRYNRYILITFVLTMAINSCRPPASLEVQVFETSADGHQLAQVATRKLPENPVEVVILPDEKHQVLEGFGGSFTEASAHLLYRMSEEARKEILEAYFGETGARYSLTRTHISSCDFSLGNYSYAMKEGDTNLEHFSIEEDMNDLVPMIREAMGTSKEGFRIIASPWTAPPWMKDNNDWRGGKLLPEYYDTWALFFSKYLDAYKAEGIDIYGITVQNEPLGNDNNWESMHFTPEEMNRFVVQHLGPQLKSAGFNTKILGFDQNRDEEMKKWADTMYDDPEAREWFDGIAVHWYASTYDHFPEALQYVHGKAPEKLIIQTEGCVDAEVPAWKNDAWYWSEEATDWGWDWAPEELRHFHPKYTPVFRYARDIIGCMNSRVNGWIDWNMVLDRQGGPNWAKNWCVAPVIVDPETDEVYYTPLYYTMAHFSRFIRPGAVRIGFRNTDADLLITAAQNPDNSLVVVIFNPEEQEKGISLVLGEQTVAFSISAKAIQTVVINPDKSKSL
jgi:glucosylceramidase